ncbi:hypothetical protein ACM01_02375 [Streptomyces viridochromogenes]|uniref:Uncharacterized protein n=1 Tax=Streptomyces viridochromogenes TaxID=1938 RepID=A0A0J7ZNL2_STRVR|nr:hypothetical protein [Streptomyces viridochromogenes]KMS76718.1 hypothetical protein ACM01_02375 [Streptomyces viridochromogenes]
MTDDVLFLSGDQVAHLPDLDAADLPGKNTHPSRSDDSVVFAYPSRLSADTGAVAKIGSVNPGNAASGLPTVHAVITVLAPVTGRLAAVMDGTAVTTPRAAVGSAVAGSRVLGGQSGVVRAGPVMDALGAGLLTPDGLVGLGAVLTGRRPARTAPGEIVYYGREGGAVTTRKGIGAGGAKRRRIATVGVRAGLREWPGDGAAVEPAEEVRP